LTSTAPRSLGERFASNTAGVGIVVKSTTNRRRLVVGEDHAATRRRLLQEGIVHFIDGSGTLAVKVRDPHETLMVGHPYRETIELALSSGRLPGHGGGGTGLGRGSATWIRRGRAQVGCRRPSAPDRWCRRELVVMMPAV